MQFRKLEWKNSSKISEYSDFFDSCALWVKSDLFCLFVRGLQHYRYVMPMTDLKVSLLFGIFFFFLLFRQVLQKVAKKGVVMSRIELSRRDQCDDFSLIKWGKFGHK